ncbi:MAG: hypothetical protein ACXV49_02700 [Halobacteriota archaeon]
MVVRIGRVVKSPYNTLRNDGLNVSLILFLTRKLMVILGIGACRGVRYETHPERKHQNSNISKRIPTGSAHTYPTLNALVEGRRWPVKRRITVREFEAAKQKLVAAKQVLEASGDALENHVGLVIEITNEIQEQVETAKRVNAMMERFINRAVAGKSGNGHAADITPTKKELLEFEALIDERFETFARIEELHSELYFTQTHSVAHELLDEIGRDPDLHKWLDAREKRRSKATERRRAAPT